MSAAALAVTFGIAASAKSPLVEQYKHKYLVALREGLAVRDPYVKKLIANYKNRYRRTGCGRRNPRNN